MTDGGPGGTGGGDLAFERPVPLRYQYVVVWGGPHAVVSVALVRRLLASPAVYETLETMGSGVAAVSSVVRGVLLPETLDLTGLGDQDGAIGH